MHEVGIVNGILDTVIRAARGAGASRAVLVTLRVGDMTEVVREALDFAWETFRDEDPLTRGCELAVEVRLLHGRELDIASIEIETPDD